MLEADPRGRREPADAQRVEFFERVPSDRWWEATIAPLLLPGETPQPGA